MPPRLCGETLEQTRRSRSQPRLGHQVGLALGPGENALAAVRRHALEVAKRLEGDDLEPEIGNPPAHVGGRAVEREQVGLENLDPLEAGCGDGFELLGQIAAERNGCDRQFHGCDVPYPQFHMGPIGVYVQHGPTPPPGQRPR